MKIFRTIAFCWPEQTSFATRVLKVCNNYSLSLGAITLQTVRHASSTWSKHRDFSFAVASSHFFDSLTETGLPFCSMSEAILVIASSHKHIGFFFHLMSHSLTKPAQESMWGPGYIFPVIYFDAYSWWKNTSPILPPLWLSWKVKIRQGSQ